MMTPSSDAEFETLRRTLPKLLGALDDSAIQALRPHLVWQWVEISGGDLLFREGDATDSVYIVVSGRLQASVAAAGGEREVVGEIGRGESVGEMGAFTGEARRATIVALRDSLLARIELTTFRRILEACPDLTLNLNKVIIERLQRRNLSHKSDHNLVNLAILPISPGLDAGPWLKKLATELERQERSVLHLTSEFIDAAAGREGVAQATDDDREMHYWLLRYLDELEGRYSLVLYEADPTPTPWTLRCLRQSDEVILLANAGCAPQLSAVERTCLASVRPTTNARQTLVLLHDKPEAFALGTPAFLNERPNVYRHFHVRAERPDDLARLARFLSGRAVGLVLAGGGARGLAHIGVFRALEEAGVPVDAFGGASIGSVLAACMAADWGWERVYSENKREFLSNPTRDYNFFPLVSLLTGRKLDRILHASFPGTHIEELWLPFFCVSSSYTRACEVVHRRGNLKRALLASMAIPGVFPPVVNERDLLVDGGVFNNMPVDVMARAGVQKIIAVDLRPKGNPFGEVTFDEMPRPWTLLADRLKRKGQRRFAVPSLITTLMAANTLNSEQKATQVLSDVDLHLKPDVEGFGLLEWKSYDLIVERGYLHTREVLGRGKPFQ